MKIYSKKHLNLLRELIISQYKLKDQSKFLGFIWSFLNPLVMLGVLFTFFSLLMKNTIEHYVIYLLIGIVQYTHFSNSTFASMRILINLKQLTSEAVFPKELLVVSSIISNVIEFIIALVITVTVAYIFGVPFSWSILLLPFVFILQLMLVSWVSLFLSCFYLYVKDIDHIYQVFLRVLFFITPIFYDPSHLGGVAKTIAALNPLTHLIGFTRTIIIEGKAFSLEVWSIMFLTNLVLIYLSFTLFKKFEPTFAENL
jgi:ABC-type polysaccharide/polyol phosphate export permease